MSQTQKKEQLIELLSRKGLQKEAGDLKSGKVSFEQMLMRAKEHWEKIAGALNGVAIHNYLHPPSSSGRVFYCVSGGVQEFQTFPLSSLFGANPNPKIIEIGPSLNYLINGTNRIFVRDCYVKLFDNIYNEENPPMHKIMVTGTPGIGKTFFLVYSAYRLVSEYGKTFILSPAGVLKIPSTECELPDGDDWYYLVDALEPKLVLCKMTVLTVLPGAQVAYEYTKHVDMFYYMPLWTWAELEEAVTVLGLKHDMNIVKHRFGILGGVFRRLFSRGFLAEVVVDDALRHTKIDDLLVPPEGDGSYNTGHVLISYEATDDFCNYTVVYASSFITQKVYAKLKLYDETKMQNFIISMEQFYKPYGLSGQLYEFLAYDKLMAGGKFKVRQLYQDDRKSNAIDVIIPPASNVMNGFLNLDDAYLGKNLHKTGAYFKPNYGFEGVDSWIHRVCMFQITTRRNRKPKPILQEVSAKCSSNILSFVVSDETDFNEFQYIEQDEPNHNANKQSILHYVLWVPPADELLGDN